MPYTDFANPPSNFSCVAVDRESNYLLPKLLVSWDAPPLISYGGNTRSYIVKVNKDCYDVGSSTCAEILLREDSIAILCSVFLDLDPLVPGRSDQAVSPIAGGVAKRVVNTAEDRRISKSIQCLYHGYYIIPL